MSATYCAGGVTKPCRNLATRGEFCDFHAKITRARERCLAGLCRPSCTRGGCTTHKSKQETQ